VALACRGRFDGEPVVYELPAAHVRQVANEPDADVAG